MPKREPPEPKPRIIDRLHRVVLPTEALDAMGVDSGDYVIVKVEGSTVVVRPVDWKER